MFLRILEAGIATLALFGLAAILVAWVVRKALREDGHGPDSTDTSVTDAAR